MSKFNNSNNFQTIIELLYEEIKTFRSETREENKHIEQVLESQSKILASHSEQMIKLMQIIHGDGNKGLIDRINALEQLQSKFSEKFAAIETREKIRATVLGMVCALCSSIGGVITYIISLYMSFTK